MAQTWFVEKLILLESSEIQFWHPLRAGLFAAICLGFGTLLHPGILKSRSRILGALITAYIYWLYRKHQDNFEFNRLGAVIYLNGTYKPCYGINILNNRFKDVGGFGTLPVPSGNLAQGNVITSVNSFCNINSNHLINISNNANCKFVYNYQLGANLANNSFVGTAYNRTTNVTQMGDAWSGYMDCKGNRTVVVMNGSVENPVSSISSWLSAGEILTIIAGAYVSFTATSMQMPYSFDGSGLTLEPGEVIQLRKVDNNGSAFFQLISHVKTNPWSHRFENIDNNLKIVGY